MRRQRTVTERQPVLHLGYIINNLSVHTRFIRAKSDRSAASCELDPNPESYDVRNLSGIHVKVCFKHKTTTRRKSTAAAAIPRSLFEPIRALVRDSAPKQRLSAPL